MCRSSTLKSPTTDHRHLTVHPAGQAGILIVRPLQELFVWIRIFPPWRSQEDVAECLNTQWFQCQFRFPVCLSAQWFIFGFRLKCTTKSFYGKSLGPRWGELTTKKVEKEKENEQLGIPVQIELLCVRNCTMIPGVNEPEERFQTKKKEQHMQHRRQSSRTQSLKLLITNSNNQPKQ